MKKKQGQLVQFLRWFEGLKALENRGRPVNPEVLDWVVKRYGNCPHVLRYLSTMEKEISPANLGFEMQNTFKRGLDLYEVKRKGVLK